MSGPTADDARRDRARRRGGTAGRLLAAAVACLALCAAPTSRPRAATPDAIPALPRTTEVADLTGNWQFVPIPLPDRGVTHILVSRAKDRIWLGTRGGVAEYDGVEAVAPAFDDADAPQPLLVTSLMEAGDGSVIVGTSNDALWRWKDGRIRSLYGACPRVSGGFCPTGDWALARSDDGVAYAASSRSASAEADALSSLRSALRERVVPVAVGASFLGFAADRLVATSAGGIVYSVDRESGGTTPLIDLGLPNGTFVRHVSYQGGRVVVGTDAKCLSVDLSPGAKPTVLADAECTAYVQRDGVAWLSTDTLRRWDRSGWLRWSPGQGGAISAEAIVEDGLGNVWVGTPAGLWRYFDVSREHRFAGGAAEVSSLTEAGDGGVVAGLRSGEVWRLSRTLEATRLDVPVDPARPGSPYYRGALVATDPTGATWALSAAGLFRFDGGKARRLADYPIPRLETGRAASSLAVSATGRACVGVSWSTKAICLDGGGWTDAAEVASEGGGSAVAAVAFDDAQALLAVGVRDVAIPAGAPAALGPFDPTAFGRKHTFGAAARTTSVPGADVVASGGWGGTAFLRRTDRGYAVVGGGRPGATEQPYLIRQFASHPALGLLAAGDEGLFRWRGTPSDGEWVSMRDVDPRLSLPLAGVVASGGRALWVASGASVTLVDLPAATPTVRMERSPPDQAVRTDAVTYRLSIPGLVGPPASKSATLTYEPDVPNAERRAAGAESRLDLSNLADLTTYRVTATATDGFLNAGGPTPSTFAVRLPFYRNPYELAGATLALLAAAGLALTRRGPTGYLLRRVGGLRWTTENSLPRLALEASVLDGGTVRYDLEAPSVPTTIRLRVDVPAQDLDAGPRDVLPHLVSSAGGTTGRFRESFDDAVARAAVLLGEAALPASLRFATSQVEGGAIDLNLAKSLLWLPLELADDGKGEQMMLRHAIGRSVSGDVLADREPLEASELRVAILSPSGDASLPDAGLEARAVAAAARSWGARVDVLPRDASKEAVLEALRTSHVFHYAGHAEFVAEAGGASYLPLAAGRLTAEDVALALRSGPNELSLAFVNGCGSSLEARWERASEVHGFASAFLANATHFVGTQWPIADEHAAAFAGGFYARLFPPSYGLWWRLVRRDPLEGVPFAEALRLARRDLREMGPSATRTWAAYVLYGDPTRRLVLR